MRRCLKSVCRDLESFWVGGLALLLLYLGKRWWRCEGEEYEWAQYLLLGTVYPALLAALATLRRLEGKTGQVAQAVQLTAAAAGALLAGSFLHGRLNYPVLGMVLAQWVLVLTVPAFRRGLGWEGDPASRCSGALFALLIGLLSWTVATRFSWWMPFARQVSASPYSFLVIAGAGLLVLVNLCRTQPADRATPGQWGRVANLAALLLLGLASVRLDPLDALPNGTSFDHWAVFVGPAELVRQGGWLLWDVPSQYGLLSILTLAWVPTATAWQSLYLVNSLLLFLSAAFLFLLFRSLRPGLANWLFSVAVTLAAVFVVPGFAPWKTGPAAFPSVGPFRYFWCYALVAILLWEFRTPPTARAHRRVLWAGCLAWLMGSLWSSDSACFCAAIWLPAYVVIAWRKARALHPSPQPFTERARRAALWLLLPPLLGLAAVGLLTAYYSVALGHLPDWHGFTEYSLSFRSGFAASPVDLGGAVWTLFLVFCGLSTLAVYFFQREHSGTGLSLLLGAWGALWSATSYFISRSHENNATNLSPLLATGVGVMLYLCARRGVVDRSATWIKIGMVPVLTVLLAMAFADKPGLMHCLDSVRRGYKSRLESYLPATEPALASLLSQAGVRPADPIVFIGDISGHADAMYSPLLRAWPVWDGGRWRYRNTYRAWLPLHPLLLCLPLPAERNQVYMERFVQRTARSGWLVQAKALDPSSPAWLFEQLRLTHRPAQVFENADWRIVKYDVMAP